MDIDTVNRAIVAVDQEIGRLSTYLAWLHDTNPTMTDTMQRVIVDLDGLLLDLREAHGYRNRLLLDYGFSAAIRWASRHQERAPQSLTERARAEAASGETDQVH